MDGRKILLFLLIFFFVFVPFVSSVEFTLKDSYDQKETLIAKISGNFIDPILRENIVFYKYYEGAEVETAVEFDLLRMDGDYYIYAQLEKEKGNYSLRIEDVRYYVGGDVSEDTILREFTILNKTADFYVKPGAVKTEKDFEIETQNLQPHEITININPENEKQITLSSGEIKNVDFELENKTGLRTITMSSNSTKYEIPVYSIISETSEENDSVLENKTNDTIEKTPDIYFSYEELNLTGEKVILTGNKIQKLFTITNSHEEEIENISLKVSSDIEKYVNLTKDYVSKLGAGESKEIGMKIFSNESKKVNGRLTLSYESGGTNYSSVMDLFLEFQNESVQENPVNQTNDTDSTLSKTCEEERGQFCNESAFCDGQQIEASDGECCLGECKLEEEDVTGKTVGWVIVIIVVLFLVWFYLVRYKGIRSKINILDEASGKGKKK